MVAGGPGRFAQCTITKLAGAPLSRSSSPGLRFRKPRINGYNSTRNFRVRTTCALPRTVRRLVRPETTVWVFTGPLFESAQPPLTRATEPHTVPSGYWKVVHIENSSAVESAAFSLEQTAGRQDTYCGGLDFFQNLPDATEDVLEAGGAALAARLGCGIRRITRNVVQVALLA